MDSEMNAVMARLANEGVRVDLDRSDKREDVFIAELPNGIRCKFLRGRLLKLMADQKLTVAGIIEARTGDSTCLQGRLMPRGKHGGHAGAGKGA